MDWQALKMFKSRSHWQFLTCLSVCIHLNWIVRGITHAALLTEQNHCRGMNHSFFHCFVIVSLWVRYSGEGGLVRLHMVNSNTVIHLVHLCFPPCLSIWNGRFCCVSGQSRDSLLCREEENWNTRRSAAAHTHSYKPACVHDCTTCIPQQSPTSS